MDFHKIIQQHESSFRKAVVGYLVDQEQVLLGLRKRVSLGLGENLISGIGGKLEGEESSRECFVREVEEEIKVTPLKFIEKGQVRFIFPNKPQWNQDVDVFLCTHWQGEPTETAEIKPEWHSLNALENIFHRMWADNPLWVPQMLREGLIPEAVFVYNDDNETIRDYVLRL